MSGKKLIIAEPSRAGKMRAGARVWLMDIVTTNDGAIIQIPKPEAVWEAEAWLFLRSQHHIRLGFKKSKKKRNIHEK